MAFEIERKFLVKTDDYKSVAYKKFTISQGFISTDKNAVVRIRITDDKAFITIKGKSNKSGTTRYEWEKEISLNEAKQLMSLSKTSLIVKTRYLVKIKNHTFEVDEFLGDNAGLVIAEIELTDEHEVFIKPDWLGEEVTGKLKYYNVMLAKNPFKNWTN
ncbi:MAG: CYTH domain-containing protein [Flavobacteriales bacterium]|jgi:adenylate cyclase|nr:CYTH domain-containing protein [Flavobacteriales bacterium]